MFVLCVVYSVVQFFCEGFNVSVWSSIYADEDVYWFGIGGAGVYVYCECFLVGNCWCFCGGVMDVAFDVGCYILLVVCLVVFYGENVVLSVIS